MFQIILGLIHKKDHIKDDNDNDADDFDFSDVIHLQNGNGLSPIQNIGLG